MTLNLVPSACVYRRGDPCACIGALPVQVPSAEKELYVVQSEHGPGCQCPGPEQVVHGGPKIQAADTGSATTPVEITFKPNPVYTDEARGLKLEGEVLLEVMFGSNGALHVNRVVRGLGHGLDEAAIAAANKMRFKPASRNGQPVDSTAVVHVVFQMAY